MIILTVVVVSNLENVNFFLNCQPFVKFYFNEFLCRKEPPSVLVGNDALLFCTTPRDRWSNNPVTLYYWQSTESTYHASDNELQWYLHKLSQD